MKVKTFTFVGVFLMNKVIYDNVGPSKKIPGIPYEDRFSLVRSIIFGNIPSPKELEPILTETTD